MFLNISTLPSLFIIYRLLDIEYSCKNVPFVDGDYEGCQCYDAQRLVNNGEIKCSNVRCPSDCDVCKVRIDQIVDCE